MLFRKKPVVVDATQITKEWFEGGAHPEGPGLSYHAGEKHIHIKTLEGTMIGKIGDWLITGVNGDLYPCKDEIFRKTYEPVNL